MTYADLIARLQAALGDDHTTDVDWAAYLPALTAQAELRCYRDLDLLSTRTKATVTLAVGASTFSAPADWMLGQSIRLTDINQFLSRRDASFVDAYGGTGRPKYWAEPTQGTIQIAPVPTIPFAAELAYHYRPVPIGPTNATTWLATNCPDLLFFACMIEATGYERNYGAQADDPKMAMSWAQRYAETLSGVRLEEARRKGDNSFDSSPAPPPPSNLPQG